MAELVFRFTRDFSLLQARASDSWPAHEAFERAGKLDHTVADCPMYRTPPPVREWTPTAGGATSSRRRPYCLGTAGAGLPQHSVEARP